jgi:hypothetical protein
LKSGLIQFNSDLINNSHTQNDVTPISALEIVSTTKGVTIPRLTSAQISAWQASFNTTTDVTGLSGAGDEKHSRQGEMVYDLSTFFKYSGSMEWYVMGICNLVIIFN